MPVLSKKLRIALFHVEIETHFARVSGREFFRKRELPKDMRKSALVQLEKLGFVETAKINGKTQYRISQSGKEYLGR